MCFFHSVPFFAGVESVLFEDLSRRYRVPRRGRLDGDAYLLRKELSDWCLAEAQASTSPTFGPLFEETVAWLKNEKITANLQLVLAFCKSWWTPEMMFAQGIGPWQAHLPTSEMVAGFRADEYSVRVVMMRWKLLVLIC